MMERRLFLGSLGASAFGLGSGTLGAQPVQQNKRKSASPTDPDPPELKPYKKAVGLMKQLPANDPRSWQAQAKIHNDFCPHNNWWFLPWHRAYLYYFELCCRDVLQDSSFALPYWDWTRNPKLPAAFLVNNSPLWQDQRNPNISISAGTAGRTIIRRILRSRTLVVPFSGSTTSDNQREASITGQLEGGPHNGVHGTVGGIMGTYMSPLDPIFWLHHCNIDRLWASWAELHANAVPGQSLWANHKLTTFYDPVQKKKVTPAASDTKNPLSYNASYDRLETLAAGPRPLMSQLGDTVLGIKTQTRQAIAGADTTAPVSSSGSVVTYRIQPQEGLGQAITQITAPAATRGKKAEMYLMLEDVPRPGNAKAALRVFLNAKNPSPATPVTDSGYVGTVAFFGDPSHAEHGGGPRTFILDVEEPAMQAKLAAAAPVDVSVVAVDLTGGGPAEVVRPGKVRLIGLS